MIYEGNNSVGKKLLGIKMAAPEISTAVMALYYNIHTCTVLSKIT